MISKKFQKKAARFVSTAVIGILMLILILNGQLYAADAPPDNSTEWVKVPSKTPLVHLASVDSFDVTENGTKAAKLMLEAIENKDSEAARKATRLYDEIVFKENFGGDYTALQWFAKYISQPEPEQKKMLADKFVASYHQFFAANNYANLKEYIYRKYQLKEYSDRYTEGGKNREAFLEDFIRFNNPRREEWERTSKILEVLNIQSGYQVADIGSGPGYFTFKFAEKVGDTGRIYAIDTVQEHLDYVESVNKKYDIKNVQPVKTEGDTIGIGENQLDFAFMCSLYHIIYTISKEEEQEVFVNSIKNALKPDGTLVIVDNAPIYGENLPYQGPYISKELIVAQLKYYGFRLVEEHSFIPQRYILTFKKA